MIEAALTVCIAGFGLPLPADLRRITCAPGVGDRVLALDTMVIDTIAPLNPWRTTQESPVHFEVAVPIAMVAFTSHRRLCPRHPARQQPRT